MHSLQPERLKDQVCGKCISNKNQFDKRARYQSRAVEEFLSPESISQTTGLVQNLDFDHIVNFTREGIELGKFWAFDLCIAAQSPRAIMDEKNLPALRAIARAGLLAFEAAREVHSRENPVALAVFSREYSVNRSFSAYFESRGCPVFNIHPRGPSFSRFYSFSVSKSDRADNALADNRLSESMSIPTTRHELKLIKTHLFSAILPIQTDRRLHYSLPKNRYTSEQIRGALGLSKLAPVVTVLMSSPDETEIAVFSDMYPPALAIPDDTQHLKAITSVAKQMPEIQFVFRWHPRGFSDDAPGPEIQSLWSTVFQDSHKIENVFHNFPADKLSLYDLAKVTDLALSYRSTAAWDFGALGIPVVQLDRSHDPAVFGYQETEGQGSTPTLEARIRAGLLTQDSIEIARPYLRLYISAFLRLNTPIRSFGRRRFTGGSWSARIMNEKLKRLPAALGRNKTLEYFLTFAIGNRWRASRAPATQALQDWENWLQPVGVPCVFREQGLIRKFQKEVWRALGPFDGQEASPARKYGNRPPKMRRSFKKPGGLEPQG